MLILVLRAPKRLADVFCQALEEILSMILLLMTLHVNPIPSASSVPIISRASTLRPNARLRPRWFCRFAQSCISGTSVSYKKAHLREKYQHLSNQIRRYASIYAGLRHQQDNNVPQLKETSVYPSHEALLLNYEQALTRQDSLTNRGYDCSAHMLWIGDRTRQLDVSSRF